MQSKPWTHTRCNTHLVSREKTKKKKEKKNAMGNSVWEAVREKRECESYMLCRERKSKRLNSYTT